MDKLVFLLEFVGTCAFSISGALSGIHKRLDIFGVLFCAVITALGGGVLRDVLLADLPPVMFREYIYVIIAVSAALPVFLLARRFKDYFIAHKELANNIVNVFDAAGLAVFTVVGMNAAISSGYGGNGFFVIFLGVTSGCGGGVIRDVCLSEIPMVFSKRIYAVASIAGGLLYHLMFVRFGVDESAAALCGMAVIFALRICASILRWNLPKAY